MLFETTPQPPQKRAHLKLATAPTMEPVSLALLKLHLRLDGDDEDALLVQYIRTARRMVEHHLRRSLLTTTWDYALDYTETKIIELPRPPLQSVTAIYVTDDDGTETTVDSDWYTVDTRSEPGRVFLNTEYVWPFHRELAGFRIRFVAGWASEDEVPVEIGQAILKIASEMYMNRELQEIPKTIGSLIQPYKVYWY